MLRFLIALISFGTGIFAVDFITSRDLVNRYKCYGIFGKCGSGKSTFMTKLAYQHAKKGWVVYTNDPSIVGVENIKYFDEEAFKKGDWLPNGKKGKINEFGEINKEDRNIVLFFDEIGSLYNNRDFKNNLTPKTLRWWKEHRHRLCKIYYGSQSYKDMDLKIRNLTEVLFIIKRSILQNFSVARPILIKFDIQNNEQGDNSGGQIVEKYSYDIFIFWKWILLRKWIKKFDSYR